MSLLDRFRLKNAQPGNASATPSVKVEPPTQQTPARQPTILELLGRSREGLPEGAAPLFGRGVSETRELHRVLELPRRQRPSEKELLEIASGLRERLGVENPACECLTTYHKAACCKALLPVQAWALLEIEQLGGLLGPIGVGHGKALDLNTRIPTPSGWKTMGELRVGDQVFDSRGRPCAVTFTTEIQYGRVCYDVLFSDGSVIRADAEHRWLTQSYLERRQADRGAKRGFGPSVRTTEEIRATLYHRHNKNHAVTAAGPLETPSIELPLDPYLLGAWLGDGTSVDGEVTSMDPEILQRFDKRFERGHSSKSGQANTQYFKGLRVVLRNIGVLGNKHVPSTYLRASREQRLALLQGLMDTDGYASKDSTVEFCSTNEKLASAVFELAASLGQIPKMYHGRATLYGKDCGPKFRVCFQPSVNVFSLCRKSDRLRLDRYKQSQIKSRRYVVSVTPCESVPVRCITVDSPDHSYLCGDGMITTHNTLLDLLAPMVVKDCKVAVLLLPPNLKAQLLEVDWNFYGQHWKLPNLIGGRWHRPGRPFLHVVAYTELSSSKNSDLLSRIKPDTIICDEAHSVRNRTASRTKRFLRYLNEHPEVRLLAWSGTLTSRSLKDYAHLSNHALRTGSPTPNSYPIVEEWAKALDPTDFRRPAGALLRFCSPGQSVADGYRERLTSTPGVVTSPDNGGCDASLNISALKVNTPGLIKNMLESLEETAERPDGEQLVDVMSVARAARELSCGFYYRWRWPRKEPEPVIKKWLEVRKEWHKEMRERLQHSSEFMDSPLLLTKAAIRWHDGYTVIDRDAEGNETGRRVIPPHTKTGPYPVWASRWWPEWKAVRDTAQPETEAVWVDDFLVKACVEWLREEPGILWYEFAAFGAAVQNACISAQVQSVFCGPGDEGNQRVLGLTGEERCVMSIKAHGTGKNLQVFSRNLVANPPSDGGAWEQLLGRTHRTGQRADEVTCEVFRHTEPMRNAVEKARNLSQYIQSTFGARQILASRATWLF